MSEDIIDKQNKDIENLTRCNKELEEELASVEKERDKLKRENENVRDWVKMLEREILSLEDKIIIGDEKKLNQLSKEIIAGRKQDILNKYLFKLPEQGGEG